MFKNNSKNWNLVFHCAHCSRVSEESKWMQPKINPKRVAFIGLRCVDPAERKTINELGIPSFSMREVDEFGIREVSGLC